MSNPSEQTPPAPAPAAAGPARPAPLPEARRVEARPAGLPRDRRLPSWPLKALAIAGWVLCWGVMACYAIPFVPALRMEPSMEWSWQYILAWAHAQNLAFGRDIAFTYGPLGFTTIDLYVPGVLGALVATRLLYTALLTASVAGLARRAGWPLPLGYALALAVTLAGTITGDPEVLNYAMAMVAIALGCLRTERGVDRLMIPAALGLALMGLTKFTLMLSGTAVVLACTGTDLYRRRLPSTLIAYVVGLGIFWVLAGQPLGTFVPWLKYSWQVADGFNDAMNVTNPDTSRVWQVALGSLLVLGAAAWARWRLPQGRTGAVALVVGGGAIFLMTFKAGFVRHDAHEIIAIRCVAMAAVAYLPVMWARRGRGGAGLWAARGLALVAVAVSLLTLRSYLHLSDRTIKGEVAKVTRRAQQRFHNATTDMWQAGFYDRYYSSVPGEVSRRLELPPTEGTVDLYGFSQARLIAAGLPYDPRLVPQGYSAYTAGLQEANAEHLRGPRAPESVLLTAEALDGRLPSLEDSLGWREILSRYAPVSLRAESRVGGSPEMISLRRSAVPRPIALELASEVQVLVGQPVAVPEGGPIWAEIELREATSGKLFGFLYKKPESYLRIVDGTGRERRFRYVPRVGTAGFILSPVVATATDYLKLFRGSEQADVCPASRARKLTLEMAAGAGVQPWYEGMMTVRFYRMRYAAEPGVTGRAGLPWTELAMSDGQVFTGPTDGSVRFVQEDGAPTLFAVPGTTFQLPVPQGRKAIAVGFGLRREVWEKARPVRFRVLAGETVLLDRVLDPKGKPEDRATAHATLDVPAGAGQLRFETRVVTSTEYTWSYWEGVSWK